MPKKKEKSSTKKLKEKRKKELKKQKKLKKENSTKEILKRDQERRDSKRISSVTDKASEVRSFKEPRVHKAEILLRVGRKLDFLELEKHVIKNGEKSRKFKFIYGVPYWTIQSTGELSNKHSILTEDTNTDEFGILLAREQILIPSEKWMTKSKKKKKKKKEQ